MRPRDVPVHAGGFGDSVWPLHHNITVTLQGMEVLSSLYAFQGIRKPPGSNREWYRIEQSAQKTTYPFHSRCNYSKCIS